MNKKYTRTGASKGKTAKYRASSTGKSWRTKARLETLLLSDLEIMAAMDSGVAPRTTEDRLRAMPLSEVEAVAKGVSYYINTERSKFNKLGITSPIMISTIQSMFGKNQKLTERAPDFRTLQKQWKPTTRAKVGRDEEGNEVITEKPMTANQTERAYMKNLIHFIESGLLYIGSEASGVAYGKQFMATTNANLKESLYGPDEPEYDRVTGEPIEREPWEAFTAQDITDFWNIYNENRDLFENYSSDEAQLFTAEYVYQAKKQGKIDKELLKSQIRERITGKDKAVYQAEAQAKFEGAYGPSRINKLPSVRQIMRPKSKGGMK